MCVEIRGQLMGIGSLLPSHGSWEIELRLSGLVANTSIPLSHLTSLFPPLPFW